MCASAASETAQGVSVCSSVRFLKLLRNPWTVARSARPVDRSTFVNVMSGHRRLSLHRRREHQAGLVTEVRRLAEHVEGLRTLGHPALLARLHPL